MARWPWGWGVSIAAVLWLLGVICCEAAATPTAPRPWRDLTIAEAIAQLEAGYRLEVLFSTDLVTPGLRVLTEPRAADPRQLLDELLAPHGLQTRKLAGGRLIVIRAPSTSQPKPEESAETTSAISGIPNAEIVVTASRYLLLSQVEPSLATLDGADVQALPDIGDDPLRAAARLPGTANDGLSGNFNVRGGDQDETLVRFDGLRLYNPFHLKDFQSLISTIDPAIVRTMDVYTGGFPVGLGDRMSGVMDINPLAVPDAPVRIASASLFSVGLMAADIFNDGRSDWLVSARRGNLDLLFNAFNARRGTPRYHDLHARLGHRLSDRLSLRANVFSFTDDLEISDPDREEVATATYQDTYFWVALDWLPIEQMSARTTLGAAKLDARRNGSADQPGISTGTLHDRRESDVALVQSDWRWQVSGGTRLDFGAELRHARGHYQYADSAHFDLLFDVPGAPTEAERSRELATHPDGTHMAAYLGLRHELGNRVTGDFGLRWDRDTLPADSDDQLSPRLALLWKAGADTQVRLALGRFAQSQSIDEVQLNDGITGYFPSQTADHMVASLRHQFSPSLELRAEAYEKRYRHLRPRFENLLNDFVVLPELKPDRIRIDAQRATARGVELSLIGDVAGPLDWWMNYSWSSIRDEVDGTEVRRSWDQSHSLGAGVAWRGALWDVTLAGNFHTGWPTTSVGLEATDPEPIAGAGPRNGERLANYRTLDLRVARRFPFEASLLTVFLELTNLTNRANECCTDYEFNTDEAVPVLQTERKSYLPILPNLGFVWEF